MSSNLSPVQNDVFIQEVFPTSADSNHSSSSYIEVSGILISIDGVPTLEPLDEANAKSSSLQKNRTDETISLGPIEISSILQEIISTSVLQTDSDIVLHTNRSGIEGIISLSSQDEQISASQTSIINVNTAKEQAIVPLTKKSEMRLSSSESPEQKKHVVYHGPLESSDPYAHWDSDSEEQEHEMELQRLQGLPKVEPELDKEYNAVIRTSGKHVDDSSLPSSSPSPSSPTTGRSYLLLLAGNSTIVRLRQKDFAKYLKLNLAARLSLEYDDVRVNRVVLAPPQLLVNVSVVTPSEAAAVIDSEEVVGEETVIDSDFVKEEEPLHMLAETNATLLELSGEEYHVVRLLSLHSHPSEKKLHEDEEGLSATSTIISDRHSNIELVIYTGIGSACALVFLVTLLITFGRYLRTADLQWPWHRPESLYSSWTLPSNHLRHRRMDEYPSVTAAPPTVIYSGSFAARAANSWVDEYQAQSSVVLADDTGGTGMLGVGAMKFPAGNPLYTNLEMGGTSRNVIMGHNAETLSIQRHQSPSKLHMFSCRPSSIVIPATMPTPHHQVRRNLQVSKETHPLDVRIREDYRLGHDNPNFQT
ncbi:hypothetical protein B7P43_G00457 [Cryptotermes secundus]|uniref:Uncharacterized protein n=2 Tax=Cryptotermes secundus TaxID=105785 RepID=A0A2J7R8I6_9NEOP|nr:hypothetical protein B7P43_G00457 [Cryptotermes secundus]